MLDSSGAAHLYFLTPRLDPQANFDRFIVLSRSISYIFSNLQHLIRCVILAFGYVFLTKYPVIVCSHVCQFLSLSNVCAYMHDANTIMDRAETDFGKSVLLHICQMPVLTMLEHHNNINSACMFYLCSCYHSQLWPDEESYNHQYFIL
jgi:hypothetical protein